MLAYNDTREWLTQAEKIGELKVIEGADPHLEIGTITQLNSKNEGPALLFDKVKGYEKGYRILTNAMSNAKLFNLTMGLPLENSIHDIVDAIRYKPREWEEKAGSFRVKEVGTGTYTGKCKGRRRD